MSFSDYLENKLLDHTFKTAAFTVPTALYVALFTAAPNDAGGGTEVSGTSYARVNHDSWDAASGGHTENTGAITFPEAGGSWGTITHFAVFDAITAGNMIVWGALTASKVVGSGDTISFADGELNVDLD